MILRKVILFVKFCGTFFAKYASVSIMVWSRELKKSLSYFIHYYSAMYFEFHKPIPLWKKILHAKLHIL